MLSRFDDYPIHQTARPIALPQSGDRNCYERYWFNGYEREAEFYFGVGAALYPNLGIADCGLSLVRDGVQHAFHASALAPERHGDVAVGPFRLEIIEPMKSLRVTIADNPTGVTCDLLWIPRTANIEEGFQQKLFGRLQLEQTRFNQFGFWQGEIRFAGETLQVSPARVYGTKDRSWGVRTLGDPVPQAPAKEMPQSFFLWAPLHWEDRCTHMGVFANQYGEVWHWDGMQLPVYERPEAIPGVEDPATEALGGVEYDLDYVPGTRRAKRARITLVHRDGKRDEIELMPQLCYRMKGIGYGHPEWGHGMWKGELAMACESWKVDEVDELAYENMHIQQVVLASSADGRRGIGALEQHSIGPYFPHGLTDLFDGAPG